MSRLRAGVAEADRSVPSGGGSLAGVDAFPFLLLLWLSRPAALIVL